MKEDKNGGEGFEELNFKAESKRWYEKSMGIFRLVL